MYSINFYINSNILYNFKRQIKINGNIFDIDDYLNRMNLNNSIITKYFVSYNIL